MSSLMKLILAVTVTAGAMACGKASSPTAPTPTTANASITSAAFTPNPINISTGSTVIWTNNDSTAHSIIADDGIFASGAIAPNGQYSYTFPSAGTFTYHDSSNANMTGTVNVSGSPPSSGY